MVGALFVFSVLNERIFAATLNAAKTRLGVTEISTSFFIHGVCAHVMLK